MKSIGIICEYNPFHLGHRKQFRLIRERCGADTAIICLISGQYVQRGEPALYPAAVRAKAAVLAGADLVLELPVTVSLRSAEGFAAGGVELLSGLGVVDGLSFGCESEAGLEETAKLLLSDAFPPALRQQLDRGISFASARQRALEQLGGDGRIIETPNNILAVEYCKAVLRQNSPLELLPVLRQGSYHDETPDAENPSATSLRMTAEFLPFVPEETWECYTGAAQYRRSCGERAMLARLRAMSEEEFSRVPFGSEGLWSKVMRECRKGGSLEEILQGSKSKRYAYSRLSRLLMCAYLGISEELLEQRAPYLRVLAIGRQGGTLLRRAREQGTIRLLHAGETAEPSAYAELEQRCGLLYGLFCEREDYRNLKENARVFCAEKM